ncbi:hypothetical protein BBJ28_00012367, partial [Nothophytophthora sp. Chile5]
PFSWVRFFIGLVSLALVFSDVPRSGLGVRNLQAIFPALEPDEILSYGSSWNYSVLSLTKSEAANNSDTARVWSYKFDSTSITWRAFARYLAVSAYPACLLYRTPCPEQYFSTEVAFTMIDSLVQELANRDSNRKSAVSIGGTGMRQPSGPMAISLRTENEYIDRLHQFLFPTLFINMNWRTNQALYYSPELLAKSNAQSICFPSIGSRAQSPRFCQELWTNFQFSCAASDIACQEVGLLYVHTFGRLREVQARFPNLTVDLTFLESQQDLQVCRGGIGSVGFRRSDVSTIIRARKCDSGLLSSSCETVYVDDYRYQTGLLVTDVVQWYRVVSALRLIGQCYFVVRALGLVLGCYYVFETPGAHEKQSTWVHIRKARHLFMKVPTQCVVFGSPFPVVCYVLAHLIDAPFTYMVLESHFFSQGGVLNLSIRLFISYAVIQMRNVWIYALVWHVVVSATTSRWRAHFNHLSSGVVGVPEFLLSGFSSVTVLAQYRSTTFRSSKILRMMELPQNVGRAWEAIKYQHSFADRGGGSVMLGGVIIDLKFLICMVLVVAGVGVARAMLVHYWTFKHKGKRHRYSRWFVLAPTPVPYSAGVLWPTVSMCVHWTSDFFCIREQQQSHSMLRAGDTGGGGQVVPLPISSGSKRNLTEDLRERLQTQSRLFSTPSARMDPNTFRFIQHQMQCLHGRADDVEANVAFMNLVLMSDPIVYLHTKFGGDRRTELAYYQSLLRPRQIVLLPEAVVGEYNEYTGALKLLRRVNASELTWAELVQCG